MAEGEGNDEGGESILVQRSLITQNVLIATTKKKTLHLTSSALKTF